MIILLLVLLLIIMRGKDLSVARFANFLELVLGVYCTFHTIKYNVCWFSWPGGKAML